MASSGCEPAARPLIGLSTYDEPARMGVWDTRFSLLHRVYVDAVERAGGIAVLLPAQDPAAAAGVVARLDGLVISGGADVDPATYGQAAHPATGRPREDRDRWETALLAAAEDRDLPALCICRGLQVLNVHRGGTLHQHLPDVVRHPGHNTEPGVFGRVGVTLTPDTPVSRALGTTPTVSCHHHQAVDRLGQGLEVIGVAADGTVEAVQAPSARFLVGVQWHPEQQDGDLPLFNALVDAAQRAAAHP